MCFVRMKSFLGYVWVILAILTTILGFKDIDKYEKLVAEKSGLHVSANWHTINNVANKSNR